MKHFKAKKQTNIFCYCNQLSGRTIKMYFAFRIVFPWIFFFLFFYLSEPCGSEHVTPAPIVLFFQCFINYILQLNKLFFLVFMSIPAAASCSDSLVT